MESVQSPFVFSPSVCVVLGLCTDLAQTQLGSGWLVKRDIHQNSVQVQSVWIRWGSVKTSSGTGQSPVPHLLDPVLHPLPKDFEHRVHVAVLISYVNDGTIIVQLDTWDKNLIMLKSAYKNVFKLTQSSMGLVLEHNKLEGFHFSWKHSDSNPDINLGYAPYTGASPLHPGTTWQYLSFFFDHPLTFQEHIK
jgi:hypothetical protein